MVGTPATKVRIVGRGRRVMATLRAAVEATLLGKDERLVAKCNVPGILAVFERWDIYDVDTLSANLASSFTELQKDLAPVAALSFLALLKATTSRVPSAPPPDTPSSAPPTTPFTEAPPCFSPPIRPLPPATVPLVTIKMNGKVLVERTTLPVPVPPAATWEVVARARLEAVHDAAEVQGYMSTPLAVSLFPTADHSPSSRRVSARPAPRSRARSAQRSEPFARLCGSESLVWTAAECRVRSRGLRRAPWDGPRPDLPGWLSYEPLVVGLTVSPIGAVM